MTSSNNSKEVTIVMVEDDDGHARLIEKNLRRAGISNQLLHFKTGGAAAHYFFEDEKGVKEAAPLLILLDLNLPEVDGYSLLAQLKENQGTKLIPVIVLTTTNNPKEIERCYALGCNVYITKPVEYEAFAESIRKLGLLLAVVQVPAAE